MSFNDLMNETEVIVFSSSSTAGTLLANLVSLEF